jgi:DNA repair exonuclease SbcCD ATPase subunit
MAYSTYYNLPGALTDALSNLDDKLGQLEEERDNAIAAQESAENDRDDYQSGLKQIADELDALVNRLAIAQSFGHADIIEEILTLALPDLAVEVRDFVNDGFSNRFG